MKEKLREYCKETIKNGDSEQRYDWAFGAISFAYKSGLINDKEYPEMLDEFDLVD